MNGYLTILTSGSFGAVYPIFIPSFSLSVIFVISDINAPFRQTTDDIPNWTSYLFEFYLLNFNRQCVIMTEILIDKLGHPLVP